MRVLLVNKFYYQRGGDCTAVLNTEKLLKGKGHDVAVFSMQHANNIHSDWKNYFPEEVHFSFPGFFKKASAAMRIFHSQDVFKQFSKLVADFKPDVIHLHNIHSYISPLVAKIANDKGIRVVWTLHDYKLVCPVYTCLRDGNICEECFHNKRSVIKHKCMKNSNIASIIAYMEACYWSRKKLTKITNVFISPSAFLKSKMTEAGYLPEQIEVLPNFMPQSITPATEKEDYYCYAGRLSAEKGIDTLLEAAGQLPYPLKIIGGGPLLDIYRKKYKLSNIEFTGQMAPEELYPIVQKSRFLVIPSVWYENNPFSVIEALCMGTPAIGARIGGIPELIEEDKNGYLFTPGDVSELRDKINLCFSDSVAFNYGKIADAAYNKFSSEAFYNKLIRIYDQ